MQSLELDAILKEVINLEDYEKSNRTYRNKTKTDGFLSDIIFVDVTYESSDKKQKNLQFALKASKGTEPFREFFKISDIFKQEIHLYDQVFPTFLDFQKNKGVTNIFNPLPTCYKTSSSKHSEFLILSNLKGDGFHSCDRQKPLDMKHLKLVLVGYAKFHALSFALLDQEPKTFGSITKKLKDIMKDHIKHTIHLMMSSFNKQVLNILEKRHENELYGKLKKFLETEDITERVMNMMAEKTTYSIVNHNDAWINNLMFQYVNGENEAPTKMAIIDWQLVSVCNSPIYDLSFLLYICCSGETLKEIKEILNIYYNALHDFIEKLGSDPKKIFPYEVFIDHWRKYKLFGILLFPMLMKFMFCSNTDVKTGNADKLEDCYKWLEDLIIEDKEYEDRIIGVYRSFFADNI